MSKLCRVKSGTLDERAIIDGGREAELASSLAASLGPLMEDAGDEDNVDLSEEDPAEVPADIMVCGVVAEIVLCS